MQNEHTQFTLRLNLAHKAWLKHQAEDQNRSVHNFIIGLIEQACRIEPLEIFIHECQSPSGTFFTASVGKYGDDFYEGDDREAAFAAAQAKVKELGLTAKSIRLNNESFNQ
ncbi:hypothetical protein [Paenochrobactrum glaciei]|uniref:Uncharacterized protein n=1 Tax=Paenochrobactrum glaciei TaxID=486407 RepID=A0ABN1FNG5_9HYPH